MPLPISEIRNLRQFLIDRNLITEQEADTAEAHAARHDVSFREALVKTETIADPDIQTAIKNANVGTHERLTRPTADALNVINARVMLKRYILPLSIEAGVLTLGMLDPFDVSLIREIERSAGVRVKGLSVTLGTFRSIAQMIARKGNDTSGGSAGKLVIDPDALKFVTREQAERSRIMPLRVNGSSMTLGVVDDTDVILLDNLSMSTGLRVIPMKLPEATLIALIRKHYGGAGDLTDLVREAAEEASQYAPAVDALDLNDADDNAVVRSINTIIRDAVLVGASDIHMEPLREGIRVRFRRDGELRLYIQFPRSTAAALVARLKVMANLNIAERRASQDGRITFRDGGAETDMRVSILPVANGEKVVMRILKKEEDILEVEDLGFSADNLSKFQDLIRKPYGMILVTGPTGSGKSFTSFSVLKRLNKPTMNIVTIEDPIEYEVRGINQVAVNPHANLTFARAVRSFLRQDPDIILVGEIRDRETASTAAEAAITGHLLLSTLHTNDAPGAVTRLREMGVENYNISGALLGVIAQRLVRRVCSHCKVPDEENVELLSVLNENQIDLPERKWARGRGCNECDDTGYRGRLAIHEVLVVDDEITSLVNADGTAAQIRDAAIRKGFRTLREDGLLKASAGQTTLEEVFIKTRE
jgi:type IV pilus assembly protein PilB